MLTVAGLAKSFGGRQLFTQVTFTLAPGRRTALVGGNGAGKTTLLELVLGIQQPDAGTVTRPRGVRLGYLPQDMAEAPAGTVLEETLAGDERLAEAAHRLHELEQAVTDPGAGPPADAVLAAFGEAQARFEQLGGYAREAEAHRVLVGLGFAPDDAGRPVAALSGGWRMRVALARLLLADPDVLLLDEPTNHLDVDSVAFLEQHLATFAGAVLFVSHDRDFIDAAATHVLDLSEGTAVEYVGGFAEFVVAREERLARAAAAAATQARRIARTERFVERFRYKATKARQVQSRLKALEKLDRLPVPELAELRARFAFPEPPRAARVVAELVGVDAGYGDHVVLHDVDLVLERGRTVALVGPNGAGKSTLVKLLTGELAPLAGSVTLGTNVTMAAFAQHQAEALDPERTVLEEFRTAVAERPGRNLRTLLGSFGFPGDTADRRVGELSGGERSRLALGRIMADPVNLLVLDEPTNHLDLPSCDLLEDALRAYPGTVLLVTHDRHLIRSVADALVVVRDGRATWHDGVDEELLAPPGARPATAAAATPTDPAVRAPKAGGGATRDLRKALAGVERRWERAEARVAELQRRLADPDLYADPDEVQRVAGDHDRAKDEADALMAEWERASAALADAEGLVER